MAIPAGSRCRQASSTSKRDLALVGPGRRRQYGRGFYPNSEGDTDMIVVKAPNGDLYNIRPEAIDAIEPAGAGESVIRLRCGAWYVVNHEVREILDKIGKA